MKLLYLSTWDFSNEKSDGVCKKINTQIGAFEEAGYQVDFIFIKGNSVIYKEEGVEHTIASVGKIKKTPAYIKMYRYIKNKHYDWVYNRYGMMDYFYCRVLKRLHENGARILIEIPAYPYCKELPDGVLYFVMYKWDQRYSKKMKPFVERILTYSKDNEIFNIPTIQVMNGVNTKEIRPISEKAQIDDTIDLLIVALMQKHHGCERLLQGLGKYYKDGGTRKILCHFVGEGPEKVCYEEIVKKEQLEKNVLFYGSKNGADLDVIYEKMDIGICSLGCYKKNAFISSELKSREYLAKGLPIVSGVTIDLFQNMESKYYLELPNSSQLVNIEDIIYFYDNIYNEDKSKQEIVSEIRNYAEKVVDIKSTMADVISIMGSSNHKN